KTVTSSLVVADVFNKRHSDVLRSINELDSSKEFNERNFALVEYRDLKGEKRPSYQITRDGFVFLAMGYTGKTAARFKEQYINAFNHLENEVQKKSDTFISELFLKDNLDALNAVKRSIAEIERKVRQLQPQLPAPRLHIPRLRDIQPIP